MGTLIAAVAAMTVAGLSDLRGRFGQAILLATLVAFFVHGTVELQAAVPGVMWPFWGMVAVAMAWAAPAEDGTLAKQPSHRLGAAGMVLVGLVACATVAPSIRPLQAGLLMHKAQVAIAAQQPQENLRYLRQAARVDPLDPNPVAAASMLCSQAGLAGTVAAAAVPARGARTVPGGGTS